LPVSRAVRAAWIVAGFALLGATASAAARPAPDVLGIRLGMTPAAVRAALRADGVARPTTIVQPCVAEYLAQHRRIVTGSRSGRCVEQINALPGVGCCSFSSTKICRGITSVVTNVALDFPSDSALTALVRRVGPPTLTDGQRPWVVALWCFDFACNNLERTVEDPASGTTLLVHQGGGATLISARGRAAREVALQHELHAHGVTLEP
jgi:hypothetical protein